MLRKLLCALVVMSVSIGFVTAEEFMASIKKVDGKKVTFSKVALGKGKDKGAKAEDVTLPVAKDAKITKAKFNKEEKKIEAGEAIEGGLKNEIFAKIGEKKDDKAGKKGGFGGGTFAQITTSEDGKTITAISVFSFGGGKKKDTKKTDN